MVIGDVHDILQICGSIWSAITESVKCSNKKYWQVMGISHRSRYQLYTWVTKGTMLVEEGHHLTVRKVLVVRAPLNNGSGES